jgi:hypothetical protein
MAELLVRQAKEHADKKLRLETEQAKHKMHLDEVQAMHSMQLEAENSKHLREMDRRRWWVQLVSTVGGLGCIGLLITVAWQFAHTGNVLPGIAIFTLGGGLIAGVYGVNRSLDKKAASLAQQIRLMTSMQQADQQPATVPETPAP